MDEFPKIGLGTSQLDDPDQCPITVASAVEMGYRHIDSAQMYGNEELVAEGLARSDVDPDELMVATKVAEDKNRYNEVIDTTRESRRKLGVDSIDLLYVHWPIGDYDPRETLPAFNELHADGVIDRVGVSNFTADLVDEAIEVLDVPVFANQVEVHPLLPPEEELLDSARRHDYAIVAYAPFCRGEAFGTPEIVEVAEKHDVSEAQVCLAWLWSHDNVVAIPKATGDAHLRDNYEALALDLDMVDIELIDSIEQRKRRFDRDNAPWH